MLRIRWIELQTTRCKEEWEKQTEALHNIKISKHPYLHVVRNECYDLLQVIMQGKFQRLRNI